MIHVERLQWRKRDDYHTRSTCGRFSVARVNVGDRCWYIAWRLPFGESEPSTEIGATTVSRDASDDERLAAIHEMQQICEAAL